MDYYPRSMRLYYLIKDNLHVKTFIVTATFDQKKRNMPALDFIQDLYQLEDDFVGILAYTMAGGRWVLSGYNHEPQLVKDAIEQNTPIIIEEDVYVEE